MCVCKYTHMCMHCVVYDLHMYQLAYFYIDILYTVYYRISLHIHTCTCVSIYVCVCVYKIDSVVNCIEFSFVGWLQLFSCKLFASAWSSGLKYPSHLRQVQVPGLTPSVSTTAQRQFPRRGLLCNRSPNCASSTPTGPCHVQTFSSYSPLSHVMATATWLGSESSGCSLTLLLLPEGPEG